MDSSPSTAVDDVAPRDRPVRNLLRGMAMGAADAVPGVSGGTVALILGIYERLLAAIGHGFRAIVAAVRLDIDTARHHLRSVEWILVLPLGAGIATALVIASSTVPGLLERFPTQSRALFLGLVAASISIPWKRRVGDTSALHVGVAVVAAVAAFVATGIPPGEITEPSTIQIFGAAAIAICAMILPGVSGSYLLLVLGMWTTTLHAVDDRNIGYVAVFGLGAVIGLGTFSLLLNWLLRNHHDTTMAALVGLMAGSLRALWPWQDADRALQLPATSSAAIGIAFIAAIGFVAVRALERTAEL